MMHNIDHNIFLYQRQYVSSATFEGHEKADLLRKYPHLVTDEFHHRKIDLDPTIRLHRLHDPSPTVLYQPPDSSQKKSAAKNPFVKPPATSGTVLSPLIQSFIAAILCYP